MSNKKAPSPYAGLIFLFGFLFVCLTDSSLKAEESFNYGSAYEVNEGLRILPQVSLDLSYAFDFSNSFVDIHSLTANAQYRLWKYLSTGIFAQYTFDKLSTAGSQIRSLEEVDINSQIPSFTWGVFSHTQVQFLLGTWNVFNTMALEAELLGGGGFGFFEENKNINENTNTKLSYLWSVDQRTRFFRHWGLSVGVFGHRGGSFFRTGLHSGFEF